MSGNDWEDDNGNNNGNDQNGPRALREAFNKLKEQLDEQKATNEKLAAENRSNTIGTILTSEGYNPKIAALIPQTIEASKDKLTAWLDENAELFPKNATPPATPVQPISAASEETGGGAEDRMGAAVALGLPPDQIRNLEAEMAAAKTPEELDKVMSAHKGVRFG